ncbi:MAG: RsmB/NOP family class I SAM-dependent RNA methyltransferase [Desulfovibrionaceae bacterium]|nr:RsmB/NOP family class I SAM-dependent RNA methyltransferase [Desulfovibrionaceae bacterium]
MLTPPKKAPPPRSFRIVADSKLVPHVHALLQMQGYVYSPEPFAKECFRLQVEPTPLGSSWAAFFGYIYIQDRSSMLPPLALNLQPGETALDLCASPGSKTSFLAQLTGRSGCILANEPKKTRLLTLQANLERLNLPQVATINVAGETLQLARPVDAIALDPPCSGWGTVAKNPQVKKLWTQEKIAPLITLQRRLLITCASLLAPGGRLLYSTCTTNEAENEGHIKFCEDNLDLVLEPITPFQGFIYAQKSTTLTINGEDSLSQGFFLAKFRKKTTSESLCIQESEDKLCDTIINKDVLQAPNLDIDQLPEGICVNTKNKVYFLPKSLQQLLQAKVKPQGFLLGTLHGTHFVPQPRLRILTPSSPNLSQAIVLEDLKDLERLFAGQSLNTDKSSKVVFMYWRDLPLGYACIKNGRLLAQFH